MTAHQPPDSDTYTPPAGGIQQSMASVFSALSHPDRLRILELLCRGESDASHLQSRLGISQSALSQHMAKLKASYLVSDRREGKHVYYALKTPKVRELVALVLSMVAVEMTNNNSELLVTYGELLTMLGVYQV